MTEEIDRELLVQDYKDNKDLALIAALAAKKQSNEEDKDEVWSRLNELTTFGLVGFGFFTCKLGIGTNNRERKATALRQSALDRDALWGNGIRVPLGNRICHGSAALTWGCLQDTNAHGDMVLLSGRHPK